MPSCRRPWRDSGARSPQEHASSAPPQSHTNARRRRRLPERAASSILVAATVLREQYAVALHQPSSSRPSIHSAEMRHSVPTTSGCSRRPCSRRRSRLAAWTSETGVLVSTTTRSARERRECWRRSNRHSCSSRSASSLTAGQLKRPAFAVKGGGWQVARRGGATCMSQASQQVFQPQAGERREGPEASGGAFVGSGAEHRGGDEEGTRGLYQPALEHCNSGQRGCDKVSC